MSAAQVNRDRAMLGRLRGKLNEAQHLAKLDPAKWRNLGVLLTRRELKRILILLDEVRK